MVIICPKKNPHPKGNSNDEEEWLYINIIRSEHGYKSQEIARIQSKSKN